MLVPQPTMTVAHLSIVSIETQFVAVELPFAWFDSQLHNGQIGSLSVFLSPHRYFQQGQVLYTCIAPRHSLAAGRLSKPRTFDSVNGNELLQQSLDGEESGYHLALPSSFHRFHALRSFSLTQFDSESCSSSIRSAELERVQSASHSADEDDITIGSRTRRR
jgi:hypothetical protein